MSTASRSDRLGAPSMSRCARVLASVLAFSLVLPPALAQAQDPVPPPPPPSGTTSPEPVAADLQPATPSPAPLDSGDEYETLRRTLPNDYDINYTFTDDARRRKRDNDPGQAAKAASRMGIAGGTLTLVGLIGAISTVTAGLVIAKKAEDDFADLVESDAISGMEPDYATRKELLKKGENGDLTAIIGGAISGAALAVGVGLLFGARSMRKRTYGPTDPGVTPTAKPGGRQPLSAKTRTNLAIYGTLLGLYGVIAIAAGAVLVGKDDDKKKRNGTILLASGGVMAAIAVPMFIVLAVDKSRRNTARLNFGPTYVRGGGGGFLSLRF